MMISIAVERFTAVFYPFSRLINIFCFFTVFLSLRIPLPTTLYTPCFKTKRLFIYIFPVIFFSIILNIFKFLEADIEWLEERATLNITQLRVDSVYILVNAWVRSGLSAPCLLCVSVGGSYVPLILNTDSRKSPDNKYVNVSL